MANGDRQKELMTQHWADVKAGVKEHNPLNVMRGKDKSPRTTVARRDFGAKMQDMYGLNVQDLAAQQNAINDKLIALGLELEQSGNTLSAAKTLASAANSSQKLLDTMMRYTAEKKGTETDKTSIITLDDVLSEAHYED